MSKQTIVILTLIVCIAGAGYWYTENQKTEPIEYPDVLSVIDDFDDDFNDLLQLDTMFGYTHQDLQLFAPVQMYPIERMNEEIEYLVTLTAERTEAEKEQHLAEYADLFELPISNGKKLGDYLSVENRPLTNEIFSILRTDLAILVANDKLFHSVARPAHIDLRVNAVHTPASPSYPSLFTAEATLATKVLGWFVEADELAVIEASVEEAIERTHKAGISTRIDTEYAKYFTNVYIDLLNDLEQTYGGLLVQARELEWNGQVPAEGFQDPITLPDLVVSKPGFTQEEGTLHFTGLMTNESEFDVYDTVMVQLVVDTYSDGDVNEMYNFAVSGLLAGQSREFEYTIDSFTPGNHTYQITVNSDLGIQEALQFNNLTEWISFQVEE